MSPDAVTATLEGHQKPFATVVIFPSETFRMAPLPLSAI
jgi:hypothetical protein